MRKQDNNTPVLILNCKLGGLAIMRSLGPLGVPLYAVEADPKDRGLKSWYCKWRFIKRFDENNPQDYLHYILSIGEQLGERTILIPTSDELSLFVAEYTQQLSRYFIFPKNDPALVETLISKEGMHHLATKHGVPAPLTLFPRSLDEVTACADEVTFPVMLKGIHGNRLLERTGKKMVIARSMDQLIENYKLLEDSHFPNLMIQEYIPGGDDQIYIFNGYFNKRSECLVAFTGRKIRQYPIHVGAASLGVCTWNKKVADITIDFLRALGYQGIVDIGYRLDPRDGLYKVLDINPRVGQAFRLFLGKDGMDVVRALYMDLKGHKVNHVVPREGRRWVIEDYDLESSLDYFREGTLKLKDWLKSFKGLEEAEWFNWKDPLPFLHMCIDLTKRAYKSIKKRLLSIRREKRRRSRQHYR